mmetsp:Transcript_22445/g.46556  ORF Transcript_22445/g.46556 Transcript_22445/m.46556 type:complete len:215 (-) Transcript_22445:456-1100(-)
MEPAVFLMVLSELLRRMKPGEAGDFRAQSPPDLCAQARPGVLPPEAGEAKRPCLEGVCLEGVVAPRCGVAPPPHVEDLGLPKPLPAVRAPVWPRLVKVELPPRPSVAEGAKVLTVARLSWWPSPGFLGSIVAASGPPPTAFSPAVWEATPSLTGSGSSGLSAGSSSSAFSSSWAMAASRLPSVPWSSRGPRRKAVIRTSEKCTSSCPPFTEEEL